MTVYKNCTQKVYPEIGELWESPCEVHLKENAISISFEGEEGEAPWHYEGVMEGEGHYKIKRIAPSDAGLTLHKFTDSKILEGFYQEDGEAGMWRIFLK